MSRTFLNYETISSTGSSAYVLTLPSTLGTVNMAQMQPKAGVAWITFDGTAPTSIVGITMSTGNVYEWHGGLHTAKLTFGGTSAAIHVNYWQ